MSGVYHHLKEANYNFIALTA